MNAVRHSAHAATLLCLFLGLAARPAAAQVQSRLTGTVTDNSGAVIVGANVEARNTATGIAYTSATNDSGTYVFPALPAGEYEVSCQHSGFKVFRRRGVMLETSFARTVDVNLEVGAITESVNVKAGTPLLESESSQVGQLIERSSVQNMPVTSRRVGSLVRLMGNVAFSSEGGNEQIPVFSMAGGRGRNQVWFLDGGIVQNVAQENATLAINPPAESLQEFKVEANNYSAEFGQAGGGLILMTTRSGTNKYHGAVYEFLRNDKFDARNFFAAGKAPLRYNIFGTSVGGPIIKDKTFFFFNYEGARRRDGSSVSNYIVPNPAEITGDFSRRTDVVLKDPVSGQPFPNNIIPSSRIDPIGQAFAKLYPAPNVASNDVTRAPRNNFAGNVSDELTQNFYTARIDHTFDTYNRIYGRYSFVEAPTVKHGLFPNEFADSRAATVANRHHNGMVSWIHNHSANLLSEIRIAYDRKANIPEALGMGSGKNGAFGLQGVDQTALARVEPTGITAIGSTNMREINNPNLSIGIPYDLTWIKSRHEVKAGVEYRYSRYLDEVDNLTGGRFIFSDRATGNGLASLLLGWTTEATVVATLPIDAIGSYYGAYVQDNWKVTPRLTVNLGLRWEMSTPYRERNNRQSGFDLQAINPVSGTPGVVTFAGLNGRSQYANDFDKNNFGPRFGFAYRTPFDLVIRGGYGIHYLPQYGFLTVRLTQGFSINQDFVSPDGGFTPAFLFRAGMPAPVPQEQLGPAFGAVKLGASPRTSPDFLQQNHQTGYMQQWNLGLQKQLTGNMLLEVAYLGNVGHKLGTIRNETLNEVPLVNGRGPARQDQQLRPYPQFTNVFLDAPAWGNSSYHALNVKLEKRYANGLNFLMNYTWAKFMDDIASTTDLGGEGSYGYGYTHVELRRFDKSLSGNDIRHRYVSSVVYELPVGRGRHWNIRNPVLEKIAGGWGTGVIAEFRDGVPYGISEQTNTSNTFSQSQRPNLLRNPDLGSDRPRSVFLARYFDTTAFQAPGQGIFGNAPRTICCGPGAINVDLKLQKKFILTERMGLIFGTDFYSLPNRPNFSNPNTSRGNAAFGIISGASGARTIQFDLRLEF